MDSKPGLMHAVSLGLTNWVGTASEISDIK